MIFKSIVKQEVLSDGSKVFNLEHCLLDTLKCMDEEQANYIKLITDRYFLELDKEGVL